MDAFERARRGDERGLNLEVHYELRRKERSMDSETQTALRERLSAALIALLEIRERGVRCRAMATSGYPIDFRHVEPLIDLLQQHRALLPSEPAACRLGQCDGSGRIPDAPGNADPGYRICRCASEPAAGPQWRYVEDGSSDTVCQHGTASDVHCCNCHSGFLFDANACVCTPEPAAGQAQEPSELLCPKCKRPALGPSTGEWLCPKCDVVFTTAEGLPAPQPVPAQDGPVKTP